MKFDMKEMKFHIKEDRVPCVSNAVDTGMHAALCGMLWGFYTAPYEAKLLGLPETATTRFRTKSVFKYGACTGLLAGIYNITRCELIKYRGKKDRLTTFAAGGFAGLVAGVGFKNWVRAGGSFLAVFCSVGGERCRDHP